MPGASTRTALCTQQGRFLVGQVSSHLVCDWSGEEGGERADKLLLMPPVQYLARKFPWLTAFCLNKRVGHCSSQASEQVREAQGLGGWVIIHGVYTLIGWNSCIVFILAQ